MIRDLVALDRFKDEVDYKQVKRVYAKYMSNIYVSQLFGTQFRDLISNMIDNNFISPSIMMSILSDLLRNFDSTVCQSMPPELYGFLERCRKFVNAQIAGTSTKNILDIADGDMERIKSFIAFTKYEILPEFYGMASKVADWEESRTTGDPDEVSCDIEFQFIERRRRRLDPSQSDFGIVNTFWKYTYLASLDLSQRWLPNTTIQKPKYLRALWGDDEFFKINL
jgi:hypothetical protein